MITFRWEITPEQVWPNISLRQINAIERDLVKMITGIAPEVEAWMKASHLWQNDTGAAEAGLHTELVHVARQFAGLLLSHGENVPHAWVLETMQRGRYGIIAPALDFFGPRLVKEARAIVQRHSS